MRIAVVDGQGGGIGKNIIESLRKAIKSDLYIIALGTNALATANMLRGGANDGATGENAVCYNVPRVDFILGTMGILVPNAILGELTPKMAASIGESDAIKVLIPFNKCSVLVMGTIDQPIQVYIEEMVKYIEKQL